MVFDVEQLILKCGELTHTLTPHFHLSSAYKGIVYIESHDIFFTLCVAVTSQPKTGCWEHIIPLTVAPIECVNHQRI